MMQMPGWDWTEWRDWTPGPDTEPPVQSGAWVDSFWIARHGWKAGPWEGRGVFRTITGDSFRLKPRHMWGNVRLTLVVRYRVWVPVERIETEEKQALDA